MIDAGEDEIAGGETDALTATARTVTLQTYAGNYHVADKGGGAALLHC